MKSIQSAFGGIRGVDGSVLRVLIGSLAEVPQEVDLAEWFPWTVGVSMKAFSVQIASFTAGTIGIGGYGYSHSESFQFIELAVWLGVGIIGASLAGMAAGLIPRKREQSLGPGTIAGFVTAAIILLVSNPDGGRWWVVWAAIGSVMGAGAGTGAAWLFEKILDHQDRAATAR